MIVRDLKNNTVLQHPAIQYLYCNLLLSTVIQEFLVTILGYLPCMLLSTSTQGDIVISEPPSDQLQYLATARTLRCQH